jgi:hypothetical protein
MKYYVLLFVMCSSFLSHAQVNQIKNASASNNSGSSGGSSGDSYSSGAVNFAGDVLINVMFSGIIRAQEEKLSRRHDVPGMVSLDLMVQAAAQPSSYYILHPRIRANWALFSTDFRFNYLVEEDIDGILFLKTNDWQILQVNYITTRSFTARIGGGFLQEAFGDEVSFFEWTTAFQYHPHASRLGCVAEYRKAEPRKEFSTYAQYKLFDKGSIHGFATGGIVYQRYYREVTTWGFQGGFLLRVY